MNSYGVSSTADIVNEKTTDEWEKIRLYKERLAAKMAAYQSRPEKKRTQHGPNWLD